MALDDFGLKLPPPHALFKLRVGQFYSIDERMRLGRYLSSYMSRCDGGVCKQEEIVEGKPNILLVTRHETLATQTEDGRSAEVEVCWECGYVKKGTVL